MTRTPSNVMNRINKHWSNICGGFYNTPKLLSYEYEAGGIEMNSFVLLSIIMNRSDLYDNDRKDGYFYIADDYIKKCSGMGRNAIIQAKNNLTFYGLVFVQKSIVHGRITYHYKMNLEGYDIFMQQRKAFFDYNKSRIANNKEKIAFDKYREKVNPEITEEKHKILGRPPTDYGKVNLLSEAEWENRFAPKLRKRVIRGKVEKPEIKAVK